MSFDNLLILSCYAQNQNDWLREQCSLVNGVLVVQGFIVVVAFLTIVFGK
jgi:hypothetical protein